MRRCPICERDSIIGHGRRRKQAHDEHHDWIGIRRGRCPDCGKTFTFLWQVGPDQWALHVPLGKLHTERLVPADPEVRRIVARILTLRALAPPTLLAKSEGLLPPRRVSRRALYYHLRAALLRAAKRAHCAGQVTPHRMRHYSESRTITR